MQINWRKIQFTLFIWYAWSLMHLKTLWEFIVFYSGLYLPLFVVDFFVQYYSLYRLDIDDINLEFFRIEYQVLYKFSYGPIKLRYDITARALWFLHFVGTSYTDFIDYVECAVPWCDIHSKKFNNDAEIAFKYIVDRYQPIRLTLKYNGQYFWERYGTEPNNPPTYDVMFNMINFSEPVYSDEE